MFKRLIAMWAIWMIGATVGWSQVVNYDQPAQPQIAAGQATSDRANATLRAAFAKSETPEEALEEIRQQLISDPNVNRSTIEVVGHGIFWHDRSGLSYGVDADLENAEQSGGL